MWLNEIGNPVAATDSKTLGISSTWAKNPLRINGLEYAGVVQWQNGSFPSFIRGFDSLHPLHIPLPPDVELIARNGPRDRHAHPAPDKPGHTRSTAMLVGYARRADGPPETPSRLS